jgi:HEAT repeat protein
MFQWFKCGGCACLVLAVASVAGLGQTADDVPKLINTIKDKDKAKVTRLEAISALGNIGAEAKAAVPTLVECLKDDGSRVQAVIALAKIGPAAKAAIPDLIAMLKDRKFAGAAWSVDGNRFSDFVSARELIIESMVKIGLEPKRCVPALAEIIADDDPRLQRFPAFQRGCLAAVKALEPMGSKAKDAVPALIQLLENKNAWSWNPQGPKASIVVLGKIGREAKSALPALRKRLESDDPEVAKSAEAAIANINKGIAEKPADPETPKEGDAPEQPDKPKEAKKPGKRRTEREEPETPPEAKKPPKRRIEVEDEEPANAGIGKFIDALGGNKAEARAEAIDALSKMGGKVVPALEKAIASADADVRKNALACLCKMGRSGRAAASTCIAALKDPSAEVRRNAAYALGRMAADSREAVASLTAALKDKDREVRLLAAFALEKAQGAK